MKTRLLAIARTLLLIWGALSLIGILTFAAIVIVQAIPEKDDSAAPSDVRFVLNWCDLGEQRVEKVVHSHNSRAFNGDHLDAYAIKISHIDVAGLQASAERNHRWYRGDELPKVVDDVIGMIDGWHHEIPWFPKAAELRSPAFHVYPWSFNYEGLQPSGADLIFIRPSDDMVFYFGAQM